MTYKNVSENLNHVGRVASAATREHANGRIDLIPRDAQQPEEYYNTIRDQYFEMSAAFQKNQTRLTELRATLRQRLPRSEFERANAEYNNLAARQTKMQGELVDLRRTVHAAGANSYGIVFSEVAKRLLDFETFTKIRRETDTLIGRNQHEVTLRAGKSPENENEKQRRKLADRRRDVRFAREIERNRGR
jgi:hypothetical protein